MPDSLAQPLQRWHDFYLLVGGAAATLVGLMFVAISLGSRLITERSLPALRVFVTPTIIHFIYALVIATVVVIPTVRRMPLGGLLVLVGILSFAQVGEGGARSPASAPGADHRYAGLDMVSHRAIGYLPPVCGDRHWAAARGRPGPRRVGGRQRHAARQRDPECLGHGGVVRAKGRVAAALMARGVRRYSRLERGSKMSWTLSPRRLNPKTSSRIAKADLTLQDPCFVRNECAAWRAEREETAGERGPGQRAKAFHCASFGNLASPEGPMALRPRIASGLLVREELLPYLMMPVLLNCIFPCEPNRCQGQESDPLPTRLRDDVISAQLLSSFAAATPS